MVAQDQIPQPAREHIEKIGTADLVIGLLAAGPQAENSAALADVRQALSQLSTPVRTVLIHGNASPHEEPPESNLRVLPYPLFMPDVPADRVQSVSTAYHAAFGLSESLGARACAVIVSDPENITSQWIYRLIQPLLDLDFDLVTPCYAHRKFEGLLNSSIVAPLTRALYGKQIEHPLGPDFGFSGRLIRRLSGAPGQARPLTALTTGAVCNGFEVCQAHLGVRQYPPADWMNQSAVLVQVLGPLFQEIERNAVFWQRIRGSQSVPLFGECAQLPNSDGPIDATRMIDSFKLGCRNLQEIWGVVLPPGTLLELTKLARLGRSQFRMADGLWVRIVYDFALGYRLRIMSPDHLLRALTPLYLAWVASWALELENAEPAAVAGRLEQLSVAYEVGKPYLVSRWRWPDRFNP